MSKSRVRNLFKKFGKSTTDLSEWNKGDDKVLKAVENGDLAKVESILQKKTINPTKLGQHGFSIFHVASRYGHLQILEKLLEYGADVNCLTIQGSTALHLASGSGHHLVVDKLIKSGAHVNIIDGQGLTPLHHACIGNHHECVQVLLGNGADIATGDQTGRTSLMFAALSGHVAICKDLLDKGANIDCVDNNKMTPLMGAANRDRKEVCEYLLKKGANRDLLDFKGVSALQHALDAGHKEIEEVFAKAPTRASWDVPGSTLERNKPSSKGAEGGKGPDYSEKPEADQVDAVASFVADDSESPTPQRKEESTTKLQKPAIVQSVDQRAQQAYKAGVSKKEIEEENEQLNEELHKLRIQNLKLQDNVTSLSNNLKEKSKTTQELEKQMKELKEQLDTESQKVEKLQQNNQSLTLSNTLTESTDDGIETDHWNDSEEDLFGSLKRGKKTGKGDEMDDKQLISLLRSQIVTYQSENEQLKHKMNDEGNEVTSSTADDVSSKKIEMLTLQLSQMQKQKDDLSEKMVMNKMGADQYKACSSILKELHSSEYQDVVEDPDFISIEDNFKSGNYDSLDDFSEDLKTLLTSNQQTEDKGKQEKLDILLKDLLYKKKLINEDVIKSNVSSTLQTTPLKNENDSDFSDDKSSIQQLRADYDKLREQNILLHQDLGTLQTTYEKLVEAGDNLQDMYDQLLSEKEEQFVKFETVAREKEEIVKENEFLLSEGNSMHDDLEKLVQELEDIQEKFKIVQSEKDELERKLGALNIPAKASEMAKIVEERDKLKEECSTLKTENERLKHDHEIVLEEVQSMQEQCNHLQGENEQMQQDFEAAQEEFDQLTQQHEGLQQDYNQLEQDYSELLADKEKLETEFLEVQTANLKAQNPLAEEETEELKQENEMLTYEKDQLEMTIKELSKNNALLEEKLEQTRGELGKTSEKLKKEASLRVKHDTEANTDKEKQIKSLQVQVSRLQQQLAETDRRHMDIVNTYRTHLLSAVQGHMDEDVQQALYNILELRSMEGYC